MKLNTNTDLSKAAPGQRAKRVLVGVWLTEETHGRYFAHLKNKAGGVRALMTRLTIRAEVAVHRLLGIGYEPWEIATVIASMGAQIGSDEMYTGHMPVESWDALGGLADRVGEDGCAVEWSWLREFGSCVGSGSALTQWLGSVYVEQWGCEIRWDRGELAGEDVRRAQMGGPGWWAEGVG